MRGRGVLSVSRPRPPRLPGADRSTSRCCNRSNRKAAADCSRTSAGTRWTRRSATDCRISRTCNLARIRRRCRKARRPSPCRTAHKTKCRGIAAQSDSLRACHSRTKATSCSFCRRSNASPRRSNSRAANHSRCTPRDNRYLARTSPRARSVARPPCRPQLRRRRRHHRVRSRRQHQPRCPHRHPTQRSLHSMSRRPCRLRRCSCRRSRCPRAGSFPRCRSCRRCRSHDPHSHCRHSSSSRSSPLATKSMPTPPAPKSNADASAYDTAVLRARAIDVIYLHLAIFCRKRPSS